MRMERLRRFSGLKVARLSHNNLLGVAALDALRRDIEQHGCGPAQIGDRGAAIEPPQEEDGRRPSLWASNTLGDQRFDTTREVEVCLPTRLANDP